MEKDLDSVSSKSCSSLVKEDNLDYSSSSIDRFLKDNLDLSSLHVGEIDHSQGSKSDDMNENDDFYQKMNRKMIENGFQSILSPDRTVDANLLNLNIENMLYEYEQRGELLKECMMEKTNASDEHRFDRLYSENEKLKKELDKSKDRVAKVEGTWKAEMDRMVEKVNMEKQGKLEMKKQLEIEKANMVKVQRELLQKEKYIEKVKNQMETTKEREGKKMDRIRKTVATLKGRKQGNLKIEDLVYMYEEEKENLKDEIAILRQELMQYQQQQAKNNVHVLDQPRDSQMLLEKMEQARLEQKKAMHDLHLREKVILKKVKRIENELQDARNAVQELGEENGNLQLAVKSRPSIASYRKLQHKLEKTQLDLASKCQLVADENERNELHAMLDTKTKIHQDKINHKLHLNRLQTLPKSILLQVVQTVCRILKINDLSLIESSILNLCKVVGSLPRLEFFIHEVYDAVIATMENKAQHIPLLRVAAIVRQWSTDIHEISQVKRFQHQVSLEIEKRSFQIQNKDQKNLTLQQCLYHIRELISLEQQWLKENDLYDQTDVLLQKRPDVLVHRIVQHVQHLFNISKVQGILPKLNETYLFVNEMKTFLNALRTSLHLKDTASSTTCLEAIQHLSSPSNSKKPDQDKENVDEYDSNANENYVVSSKKQQIFGLQKVYEMNSTITALQDEIGAPTMEEILPRVKRLMIMLTQQDSYMGTPDTTEHFDEDSD